MNNIPMLSLIYLGLAILLEVTGTLSMKASLGFTRIVPGIVMIVSYISCFALLTLAIKQLEVGTVYAVWAGVGTALITIGGVVFFHDSWTVLKGVSIFLIILGVVGLNISGAAH